MILNCKSKPHAYYNTMFISTSVFHDISQSLKHLSWDMKYISIGLKIQNDNLYDVDYTSDTLHNRSKRIRWLRQ